MIDRREAMYWSAVENGSAQCGLCPHCCVIAENSVGICGVRENRNGVLTASGYGRVSSIALDPIEKKPLYMFHPGKRILSVGGFGCNLKCPFCQNFEISVLAPSPRELSAKLTEGVLAPSPRELSAKLTEGAPPYSPTEIAALAIQTVPNGNIGVAYTYNEPLIGYEFVYDCAMLVRDAGLCNALVTNGYINTEPLNNLLPLIDAMNIDLKGFTDGFYRKLGGKLETVKEAITLSRKYCHVEVTTLVIPGENENEIEELARWLASIDPDIPLHLTRFFPRYRYSDRAPTPRDTIHKLQAIAMRYLKNVFTGNM